MARIDAGALLGPYQVIKLLPEGTGGMAQVCIARLADDPNGLPVAVKFTKSLDERGDGRDDLEETLRDALNNEVEILKGLRHPNIVRLYPIRAELRTTPYIARATNLPGRPWYCVMEYLAGGSLASELDHAGGGHLSLKTAVEIAYQVAQALEYIHLKRVAHLDLKPDNILFRRPLVSSAPPEVALIDFGIARREKQTGLKAGAAAYMAPERIMLVRGELTGKPDDQRPADVYSLGVVLYRSIAGKLPFGRRDKSTTTEIILKEEPVPLSRYVHDIPPAVEDITMRCLTRDVKKRATIPEVLAALDEAVPPPRWTVSRRPGIKSSVPPEDNPEAEDAPGGKRSSAQKSEPLEIGDGGGHGRGRVFGIALAAVIVLGMLGGGFMFLSPLLNPTPTPTPAIVATVAPTRAPASSSQPAAAPATVVPPTEAAPPTVTPLPTRTPAPTQTPYVPPAPVAAKPAGGTAFVDKDAGNIVLQWTANGELPENYYYVVSVKKNLVGQAGSTLTFESRDTKVALPASVFANVPVGSTATFDWSVAIKRSSASTVEGTRIWDSDFSGPSSKSLAFSYLAPTPTPTAGPTATATK